MKKTLFLLLTVISVFSSSCGTNEPVLTDKEWWDVVVTTTYTRIEKKSGALYDPWVDFSKNSNTNITTYAAPNVTLSGSKSEIDKIIVEYYKDAGYLISTDNFPILFNVTEIVYNGSMFDMIFASRIRTYSKSIKK